MKNTVLLSISWIILSSFTIHSTHNQSVTTKSPAHNIPVISVSITEKLPQFLSVNLQIEKVFLYANQLTDEKFKLAIPATKAYFANHLKIYLNGKEQPLQLKFISENKLRVDIQFQIQSKEELQSIKVFSDCMATMELHDRMPIRINIGETKRTFRIDKERTDIKINF